MNEATQRLLPASLLTLALHGAFFSWQMENRPIELPKPEKISVTLRKPPPPPPPQNKIVKELPPPPELKPLEHKPLETLPPQQSKVVKQRRKPPEVKPVRRKPLEQLPPPQRTIARRLPPPPAVAPAAALRPMETLPPAPPAQSRVFRQLPRLPANLAAVSQPSLRPLETLPALPAPEPVVWEEPPPQEVVFEEVVEEEIVETEPVYEEVVEEYTPPPVEYVEAVEEQVWEEPPPRRVQPQRQHVQQERRRQSDYVPQPQPSRRQAESSRAFSSSGAGDQEAAPLYASNPPPEYPMQARRRGLQGVVTIEALIDASGNVADLRLFASSGHSILDKAALSSVRGWRFQPGTVGGRRKQMWVKVPVRFELN
jgi:protein TonB